MNLALRDLKIGTDIQFDNRAVFSASPDPNWVDAIVVDLLSSQLVAEHMERERPYTVFRFYKDLEVTWRFKP